MAISDKAEDDHDASLARSAEESLPACFARVAAEFPTRPALISDGWRPTYAELDASANRLAQALLGHHGMRGDRVAILMQHDTPLIAAMLAILKAARIVVVLDPTHPADRLRELVNDAEPALILTDAVNHELAANVAGANCAIIRADALTAGPAHVLDMPVGSDETAFLVYTSGSTGRPKGVMQTHRRIRHNAISYHRAMEFVANDRISLLVSPSGGHGVTTTWCALSFGAALCPLPIMEKGVTSLAQWMIDREITVYITAPSAFRTFMKTLDAGIIFPHVRVVQVGSEPATAQDFRAYQRHFSGRCLFIHTLSSSETGTIAQLRLSQADVVPDGRLPVGKICEGVDVELLGERGQKVRPGEIGEIVVRSRYLSAGYWRDDALTAQRFSDAPEGNGLRIFCTGDLGRFNDAGLLEFIGRNDGRLKIRGNRIETAEVADVLLRQPAVEQAALCAVSQGNSEAQLVAYVVPHEGQGYSARILRNALRAVLPSHMVPSAFVFLDRLPITPHGKVDYEKLRRLPLPKRERKPFETAVTETESPARQCLGAGL